MANVSTCWHCSQPCRYRVATPLTSRTVCADHLAAEVERLATGQLGDAVTVGLCDSPRVLTAEEFEQMRAALADPDYLRRLAQDVERERMIEVDNPYRTELRKRRGTE